MAGAKPNEKCLPCLLCEPVCPTAAIKVTFDKTREDFGPLREGIEGKISIDQEKCNLCGRCARFCKAFLLVDKVEKDRDPRDLVPYEQLLIDEDLCDYCGLCVPLCPEEAIAVEGEPLKLDEEPKIEGKIKVDESLCIGCGRCALVCPYEGMDISKPFQGEIRMVEKNLVRCDPLGCLAASTSVRQMLVCDKRAKPPRWKISASSAAARRPVPSRRLMCRAESAIRR